MGGSTKMGIGRMTRVKAVSMIAWGDARTLCTRFTSNTAIKSDFVFSFMRSDSQGADLQERSRKLKCFQPPSRLKTNKKEINNSLCKNIQFGYRRLTCLAAILEDPTTFPLSSSTSIPSDSSVCLIKPTLQMFAVAEEQEDGETLQFNTSLKKQDKKCSQ